MAGKQVKSFECPACGGQVELRAAGHTISAICSHCSSLIDTANDQFKIIKKDFQQSRQIKIPIGTMGILDLVKWEVIGYVEKKDMAYPAFWEEYLLFNPYFGFRFLVQAEGHWNLATVIKRDVALAGSASELQFDNEKYSVFCRGQSQIQYVMGEFYWRIRKGDQDSYSDYIAPPRMLSVEKNPQEITLSLAEYLPPEEVEKAFNVRLADTTGVAPNQPPPLAGVLSEIWKTALWALFIAFFIQIISGSDTQLNSTNLYIYQHEAGKSFSTPVFTVPARANLVVYSAAPLQNNWMELDLTLSNENSQKAYATTQVIEYYSGYDSDGYWTEGSTSGDSSFSSIEKGDYRLLIEPAVGQIPPAGMPVQIQIKHNASIWGNFWIIAFLILFLPVSIAIYRWYFEYKRWENSDYAPAIYKVNSDE